MPALQASNGRHEHPDNEHLRRRHITCELIRGLVEAGREPDPVLVLRRASSQSASDTLHPRQPATPRYYHNLALYLAAAYAQVVDPHNARSYAREVLEDAYRRALQEHGIRMAQLAESGAEIAAIRAQASELIRLIEQWTGVSQAGIP
jgi:replicative DNA helicase